MWLLCVTNQENSSLIVNALQNKISGEFDALKADSACEEIAIAINESDLIDYIFTNYTLDLPTGNTVITKTSAYTVGLSASAMITKGYPSIKLTGSIGASNSSQPTIASTISYSVKDGNGNILNSGYVMNNNVSGVITFTVDWTKSETDYAYLQITSPGVGGYFHCIEAVTA